MSCSFRMHPAPSHRTWHKQQVLHALISGWLPLNRNQRHNDALYKNQTFIRAVYKRRVYMYVHFYFSSGPTTTSASQQPDPVPS